MKNSGVEWIGEIPEDWEVSKTKYLTKLYTGNSIKDEEKNLYEDKADAVPYISSKDINATFSTTNYENGMYVKHFDNSFVRAPAGSTLMCIEGGSAGKKKTFLNQEVCFVNKLCCFSPIKIDSKFLFYSLNSPNYEEEFRFNISGMIGGVSVGKLNQFILPKPPKSTQQRIASYLDKKCNKIEETIQNQQQVIEKLKTYKQSLITEAVTGKIKIQNGKVCGKYQSYKESGVEWIGKIPSEWEVGKFGRFAQVKSNLVDPNLYLEYPQIAPDNIGKGSGKLIDWQTVKDSGVISWNHLFFKGQIVYSKIRPTLNKLIIAPFDGLCSADMYPIETNIHKQFFVYMMLSQYFVEQVGLITRDRVKMPKINQNELSGILITVPTKEEQKEISDYLDKKCTAIDTAIEQKQKLIEKLTEYKKSLIYECVTGKKEI